MREVLIDVTYPWLPLKCENCGKYGHKKENCKVGVPAGPSMDSSPKVMDIRTQTVASVDAIQDSDAAFDEIADGFAET